MFRLVNKVLEELSEEYVPASLKPCFTKLRRKRLKLRNVFRLLFHEYLVVPDSALYERIFLRLLTGKIIAVYKQPLDPLVTDSSGVASEINPFRELVLDPVSNTADAGVEDFELLFRKLRRFVNEKNVTFRSLEVVQVLLVGAVFENYLAPVDEGDFLLGIVVFV